MNRRRRVGYSDVMSTLAVFLALTGGSIAIAAVGKDEVGSREVENESLKSKDLRDGKAVGSSDIIDGTVGSGDIADGSVGSADIGDGSVGAADIAGGAVGRAAIANDAVGAAQVEDASLTGADVVNNSLTGADVAEATLGGIGAGSLGELPHALVYATTNQSMTNNNLGTVAMDTVESSFDVTFNNTLNTLTINTPGIYLLSGALNWAQNATGSREAAFQLNGSVTGFYGADTTAPLGTTGDLMAINWMGDLDAGDVVTFAGFQDSGAALNTGLAYGRTASLAVQWLGP